MSRDRLSWIPLAPLTFLLIAGCAASGAQLVGTVTAVSPQTQTLTVRDAAGETTVHVTGNTHFWSGNSLDQVQAGDRASLQIERQGEAVTARSIQVFPAGRPRTRWIGPGGY